MKSILISIQPQWVAMIVHKKKTLEIRKTMPKCELPCKVYIYCSWGDMRTNYMLGKRGKVVAEFTLNNVECFTTDYRKNVEQTERISKDSCVGMSDLIEYEYGKPCLYAWHIDDLKIYDKPKELSEFTHYIPNNKCPKKECGIDCEDCMSYDGEHETCLALYYAHREIKRPPQSWYYVEGLYEN